MALLFASISVHIAFKRVQYVFRLHLRYLSHRLVGMSHMRRGVRLRLCIILSLINRGSYLALLFTSTTGEHFID